VNERLINEIEDIHALDQVDAAELADTIVDAIIDALKRDLALPKRKSIEWNLALAKAHAFAVEQIHNRIFNHVDREDALRACEWEG
jgi:hypothetical protein